MNYKHELINPLSPYLNTASSKPGNKARKWILTFTIHLGFKFLINLLFFLVDLIPGTSQDAVVSQSLVLNNSILFLGPISLDSHFDSRVNGLTKSLDSVWSKIACLHILPACFFYTIFISNQTAKRRRPREVELWKIERVYRLICLSM